jgi:hypothetical protein
MRREDMSGPGGIAGQLADSRGGRPAAPLRARALRARRRRQVSRPAPAGSQSPPQRTQVHRDRENPPGRLPTPSAPIAVR